MLCGVRDENMACPVSLLSIFCNSDLLSWLLRNRKSTCIDKIKFTFVVLVILQACFASLVSQDYVNGTDQEEIRTGELFSLLFCSLIYSILSS